MQENYIVSKGDAAEATYCPGIYALSQSAADQKLCKGGSYLRSSCTKREAARGTCQWEAVKTHHSDMDITVVTIDKCGTGILFQQQLLHSCPHISEVEKIKFNGCLNSHFVQVLKSFCTSLDNQVISFT